jgi:hypothetical protein
MTDFAPPMISRTYERVAKPLVSLGERNPFAFAVSASSRPKTKDREIRAASRLVRQTSPRVCGSEMAPQAIGTAENRLGMAPSRFAVKARRIDRETFVSVLDHTYVRGGRVLHPDDMVTGVDVDNFAGDAARHG